MPDAELGTNFEPESVTDNRISSVKAGYADKDKTTVKVEILLNQDLPYIVQEDGNRLGIILQGSVKSEAAESAVAYGIETSDTVEGAPVEEGKIVIPTTTANLTNIEFETKETGHSDIKIKTDHPVRYETLQGGGDELHLILYDTKIPVHHQRPLLTRYFNSAVERVDPEPNPENINDTRVKIKIRDQVPFRVVQTKAGIHMSFEPSSVQPPEFVKAKKSVISGQKTLVASLDESPQSPNRGLAAVPAQGAGAMSTQPQMSYPQPDPLLNPSSVRYTGEKIKLDFYETDIKNVFRILRSVSGLNFAIDKNVTGKVTLSLEEPVPWDQVMDLVLKMNGLGKKMEGNVVRIATIETIAKEEQEVQDAIAARKKSEEQKKALEPLITEYIPINYSDANKDIEPHVTKILTPDRGKISVDTRTNMVILTDTQAVIDQAHDLIYRLDKVTPQIMIEAKIVEVTKEFSRSFGINWNLSNDSTITSGFVDDFSVAVNSATQIGIAGDFTFFGLLGSSRTALNAQLEASEEQGDVRVVSSPRILTLDNKEAMIKQGQEYAYLERDDSGGSSVAFKDIDLLLEVTPHVTPDNRISMTVHVTKNDIASFSSDGTPNLSTNEATTELLVNNNDTVVIGGVIKTTQSKDDDGIPFLTGIPGLGYLFSTKSESDDRNELLIFLTPSIVQLEQKRHISN
ncbi:MAG: type IV pilus secretin PilQ [Desulfobacterales bacterium]|nr:type IV pilus secretin PilQ [Desulfobacterales bacterium]